MTGPVITRRAVLGAAGAAAGWALTAEPLRAAQESAAPVRLGLIGIGRRCHGHINIIKRLGERVRVTATCDLIPERAEEGARLIGGSGIRTFNRHQELLAAKLCDAVVITTPNYAHKAISVDALQAGCHVLCEKPMATTLADADAMVDAVAKSGRVFAVGQQFRYAPIYQKVRELLKTGTIGELKYVAAEEYRGDWARLFKDDAENNAKNWRYYQKLSGGTLVEKNCHDFDILTWLIGADPARVTASGGNSVHRGRETIDHAAVTVVYEGGIQLLFGMALFSPVHRSNTTFVGTKGLLAFPRGGTWLEISRPGKNAERVEVTAESSDRLDDRGVMGLYQEFLEGIKTGRQPRGDVYVGRNALVIPLAAEQAIVERQGLSVPAFRRS